MSDLLQARINSQVIGQPETMALSMALYVHGIKEAIVSPLKGRLGQVSMALVVL